MGGRLCLVLGSLASMDCGLRVDAYASCYACTRWWCDVSCFVAAVAGLKVVSFDRRLILVGFYHLRYERWEVCFEFSSEGRDGLGE